MKKNLMQRTKVFIALSLVTFLSGCSEHLEWNQKLTIVIGTPEGQMEFSAVQSVRLETTSEKYDQIVAGAAGPDGHAYFLQGQAPYIKLPSGHLIVALIMGNGSPNSEPGRMALSYLGNPSIKGPEIDDDARAAFDSTAVGFSVEIPRQDWPYLVVIPPDGNIEELQPVNGRAEQALETLIGPGYAVETVKVMKTADAVGPITIDAVIPCLSKDTPNCQFRQLPREVRNTRYAMRPGSFLRRDSQR